MKATLNRQAQVQDYYGSVLTGSDDLKTNACCTTLDMPVHISAILGDIHDEVLARYYGCGLSVPDALSGCTVLDLGCGSGRDVYLVSHLVGEHGAVVGVDMTPEQLAVANAHVDYHREKWGYARSNVRFVQGDIERLDALDLPDDHFDVIISNCVINLASNKRAVLEQAYRLLKPGGEMYFSDIYCNRRIPTQLQQDPVLWGECLAGALYSNDFENLARTTGFADPRVVEAEALQLTNTEVAAKLDGFMFRSVTYRLFKLDALEAGNEDYGHAVTYRGTIPHCPDRFVLDEQHHFASGERVRVSGNSYRMIAASRLAEHFMLEGDFSTHLGAFQATTAASAAAPATAAGEASCKPARKTCC